MLTSLEFLFRRALPSCGGSLLCCAPDDGTELHLHGRFAVLPTTRRER